MLLFLHSLTRWLVVLTALVAVVVYALVFVKQIKPSAGVWRIMQLFTSVLTVQAALGILLLFVTWSSSGTVARFQMEHAAVGLIAVAIGHASAMWRKRDATTRARNNVIDVIVVLIVIYVGVSLLPGGWSRAFLPSL
jgi:hypothetical protein